ncbi:MAG: S9 family peptidase [Thermomicrobiales bacterium]|nr:S9 family peptidase [Thermomicrobiales bacterium]
MAKAAASKRPITAEDLFNIPIVSDPRLSPDGKQVAYVVTRLCKESDAYKAAIWVAPLSGGNGVQLTSGNHRDGAPRWSPDGSTIAFTSNRTGLAPLDKEGKPVEATGKKSPPQVWTIALGGGEARQVTRQQFGASSPEWSPDGRTLAFLSATEPAGEPGVPEPAHQKIADERVLTKMSYRFDGRGFIERYTHLFTIPATGGTATQLTFGDCEDGGIAWSPDGRTIAFVSLRHESRDAERYTLVYTVPAAGGEVKCLTPGEYDFDQISWSPDGTRMVAVGNDDVVARGAKNDLLWTVSASGGDPTPITRGWELSVGDAGMSDVFMGGDHRPQWLDDGNVLVLASSRGATNAYRIDLGRKKASQVTSGTRRVAAISANAGGGEIVYNVGESDQPFELHASKATGRGERKLTDQSAAFTGAVWLSPAEEITFTSQAGDREIQGWVLKPYGFKKKVKYPLIVQIHGGPHAMYGNALFHEMQLMAARGYAVLFTNPRGSSGYGEEFTGCTRERWGESDMPDVMGGLDAALKLGFIDESRLGVTGGSYGGYLTNWIIGHTDRFKAAVTQRCVSNFYSMIGTSDIGFNFAVYESGGTPWADTDKLLKHSPISYVEAMTTPLLIIHNEQDLRCPIEQAEQLYMFLKMLKRDVAMVRIPDEDHNLSRTGTPSRRLARLHHMIAWFDTHL